MIPLERLRAAPVLRSAGASCRRRSDPRRGGGNVAALFPGRQTRLPLGGPRVRGVRGSTMDSLPPCFPLDGARAARRRGCWPLGGGGPRPSVHTCVVSPRGACSRSTAAAVLRACWEHRARTRLLSGCARTREPRQELFSRGTVEAVPRVCDFPVSCAHATRRPGCPLTLITDQ